MDNYKVIFHVSDNSNLSHGLINIKNLMRDLGENGEIELLLNGDAVTLMLSNEDKLYDKVIELKEKGVTFAVCGNSMKNMDISKEELRDFAYIVPSGVGELVKKQAQGWGYIKP
ncbi:DsrE family protein [Clostridium polynesiense]|uniref:DsrE family protein n=1 Tax=Clostridium polynesiense TaxID=1325933 RepID=UPI00058F6D0A|nr:DsrE family protein [Clostridium polynesiense]